LTELINANRNGRTISAKPRPKADNVVNLMDALKKSIANEPPKGNKPRKAAAGQKEMLLSIEGKKPAAKKSCEARARDRAPQGRITTPRCA
jgi:DNA end-binding protein Ku